MKNNGQARAVNTKLAALLKSEGIYVDPRDFWVQEGFYRTQDCARWGVVGKWINPTSTQNTGMLQVFCWDTMTNCVRYGITVDEGKKDVWQVEVHSKEL